jgi:hypothetical protein
MLPGLLVSLVGADHEREQGGCVYENAAHSKDVAR